MGPRLRIVCVALALAVLPIPCLAVRQHGWTTLETHGYGTEMILWGLLVIGATTAVPAALIGRKMRRASAAPWLALAASQALVLAAVLYTDAYLDACMRAEGSNPAYCSPSTW